MSTDHVSPGARRSCPLRRCYAPAGLPPRFAAFWSIYDSTAPGIADTVYVTLASTSKPDANDAAYALHYAVAALSVNSLQIPRPGPHASMDSLEDFRFSV